MAEIWETEYLHLVGELFANLDENNSFREISLDDESETPSLTMIPDLGNEGYEDVRFRVTVEHILEGSVQLKIMVSMFSDVPADMLGEAEKVVARINEFMILGNAAIFYDGGMIFFNHAFAVDREMDTLLAVSLLGKSLEIIVKTVPQVMDILAPLLDGTETADEIISDGIGLIQ